MGEAPARRFEADAETAGPGETALGALREAIEAEGWRTWALGGELLLVRRQGQEVPLPHELWPLLQQLPDWPRLEVVAPGVLRTMASPGARHQYAADELRRQLNEREGRWGPGRWWFEWERGLVLGRRLLVPDGCAWRLGPDDPVPPPWTEPNPIERVPDWVLEVLSEGTASYDRGVKADYYGDAGVRWLWLLDPEARRLQSFELRVGRWVARGELRGEEEGVLPPFESAVRAGALWRPAPAVRGDKGQGAGR